MIAFIALICIVLVAFIIYAIVARDPAFYDHTIGLIGSAREKVQAKRR